MPAPKPLQVTQGAWIKHYLSPRLIHILGAPDALGARPTIAAMDDVQMEANATLFMAAPDMWRDGWALLDALTPDWLAYPAVQSAADDLRATLLRAVA